jgi:hypothetical protein
MLLLAVSPSRAAARARETIPAALFLRHQLQRQFVPMAASTGVSKVFEPQRIAVELTASRNFMAHIREIEAKYDPTDSKITESDAFTKELERHKQLEEKLKGGSSQRREGIMSTNDFTVTITSMANGQLRFSVNSANPPLSDKVYVRPAPGLNEAIIEALRSGNADAATILEAETGITDWLLSNPPDAFFEKLSAALAAPVPVRLIFRLEDALRITLGQLPIELARPQSGYLIFSKNLQSIMHLPPYDGPAQTSLSAPGYPLRVLIVRSNPINLGGAVPPALPIRKKIKEDSGYRGEIFRGRTNRSGPAEQGEYRFEPADMGAFSEADRGELSSTGLFGTWSLKFEDDCGKNPVSVAPDQLNLCLQNHPVLVVLLVGCLTAAQFQQNYLAGFPEKQQQALLNWIRGNQGGAQALVESDSGVQLAVGMRCKLDTDLAQDFLL